MVNWKEDFKKVIRTPMGCSYGVYLDRMETTTMYWEVVSHMIGAQLGPKSGLFAVVKRKFLPLQGIETWSSTSQSAVLQAICVHYYLALPKINILLICFKQFCFQKDIRNLQFKGPFGSLPITPAVPNKLQVLILYVNTVRSSLQESFLICKPKRQ